MRRSFGLRSRESRKGWARLAAALLVAFALKVCASAEAGPVKRPEPSYECRDFVAVFSPEGDLLGVLSRLEPELLQAKKVCDEPENPCVHAVFVEGRAGRVLCGPKDQPRKSQKS